MIDLKSVSYLPPGGLQVVHFIICFHVDFSTGDSDQIRSHAAVELYIHDMIELSISRWGFHQYSIDKKNAER